LEKNLIVHQPFFVPAALFAALAAPLLLGLVPRNRFYGVRTAKTLSDPGSWKNVNRLCGALMLVSSGVYFAVAASTPLADGKDFGLWLEHLAAFALPIAGSVWAALRAS
jgi:uncharacterized membrane protein